MEEKKGFSEKLGEFFAGKGFYIVLLLCAALIGTSIWLMADGSRADVETAAGGEPIIGAPGADVRDGGARNGAAGAQTQEAVLPERVETMLPAEEEAGEETAAVEPEEPAVVPEPAPAVETMEEIPAVDYFIWPVNGTLARAYSAETLSYDRTMADWRTHAGWDILAPAGTQVLSTANGIVSAVYDDALMGAVVEVNHGSGLRSVYANLAAGPMAAVGQIVSVGSVLGTVGATALSETGEESHLHFAMTMNGESVDPGDWLPRP